MARPKDLSLEHTWRLRLRRQAASGLSISAFCAREGVSSASFYAWRRRLAAPPPAVRPDTPLFIPLQFDAAPSPLETANSETARQYARPGAARTHDDRHQHPLRTCQSRPRAQCRWHRSHLSPGSEDRPHPGDRSQASPPQEASALPRIRPRPEHRLQDRNTAPRVVGPVESSISKGLGMVALTGHGVVLGGGSAGAAMMAGSRMDRPGNRAKSGPLKVGSRVMP